MQGEKDIDDALKNINILIENLGAEKSRKKKTQRTVIIKRDEYGNRTYPSKSRKKYPSSLKSVKSKETVSPPPAQASQNLSPSQDQEQHINYETSDASMSDLCKREDIDTVLREIDSLVSSTSWKPHIRKKKKSWFNRMVEKEMSWSDHRESVLQADIKTNYEINCICNHCQKNEAIIKCGSCPEQYFCGKCDNAIHYDFPLHNRSVWVDEYWYKLCNNEIVESGEIKDRASMVPLIARKCRMCGSFDIEKQLNQNICTVINLTGRYDLFQFDICCNQCQNIYNPFNIFSVMESGYFPAYPNKFFLLFDVAVFELWDAFRKNMPGSSERAFIESLNSMTVQKGRVGKINQENFTVAFKEWCFIEHKKNIIRDINWMECPCCSIKQHSCHVDGNCKLYRYRNSGRRRRKSFYDGAFLVPDEERDCYLQKVYPLGIKKDKDNIDSSCGGIWNAARNKPLARKAVDVTGLEVATCRHQLAQKAINMTQGELYAYAMFLVKYYMVEKQNVNYVFADVMCKLIKFIERHEPELAKRFKGALSVMHAKGHSINCQILWDGEWIEGTGRSTGEECEQFFSYLSRASNTTKYQRPENREETLTELAQFWNKRKIEKLAISLSERYNKICKDLENWQKKMKSICDERNLIEKDVDWNGLISKARDHACRVKSKHLSPLSSTQTAVLLYADLKMWPKDGSQEMKALLDEVPLPKLKHLKLPFLTKPRDEKELLLKDLVRGCNKDTVLQELDALKQTYLPKAFSIAKDELNFEKVHWAARMQKCADTAKRRTFFRKKLSVVTKKYEELVQSFEEYTELEQVSNENLVTENFELTATDDRVLLEAHLKIQRCKEELLLLKQDMQSYLSYYTSKISELKKKVREMASLNSDDDSEDLIHVNPHQKLLKATISLMKQGILSFENQLARGVKEFASVIPSMETIADGFLADFENDFDNSAESDSSSDEDEFDEKSDDDESEITLEEVKSIGLEFSLHHDKCFKETTLPSGTIKLSLASDLCQSRIGNRNGSNACTCISLLTGFVIKKANTMITEKDTIVTYFVGCMELGNILYRGNAFLSSTEALTVLQDTLHVRIAEEWNFLTSDNEPFAKLIDSYTETGFGYFLIIASGKSICLLNLGEHVVIFDSHGSEDDGASISIFNKDSFLDIFHQIYSLAGENVIYVCHVVS